MEAIIAALAGISVALLVLGAFRRNERALVTRRIEQFVAERPADPYEGSFMQRILGPPARGARQALTYLLPAKALAALARKMDTAGLRMPAATFAGLWVAFAVIVPVGASMLTVVLGGTPGTKAMMALVLWGAAGLFLPWYWLRRRAAKRSRGISRALPDAIDLIVTSVEAGIGLQGAMLNVSKKFRGSIGEEFAQVIRETSVGRSRAEALQAMGVRSGSRELQLFTRAINQAEQMGISIADVLRNQASEVRERRRQHAREQASKIPVKMTFPTVLLIFPTLFMLILGPVVLRAVELFSN